MKNLEIMNKISRTFYKVGFELKKHSPEILVVAGVVGTVASAIMACKATTKVNDILDQTKKDVDNVHKVLEDENISEEEYSVEDSKKDLAIIYSQTAVKFVKLYGPSVLLGAASITSILCGHNILRKRNLALAAAYAAVDGSFKDYRKRVVDRFGKDLDRELRYNIKATEVEEKVTDENGKETTVKKIVNVPDTNMPSEFSRFFDEYCEAWTKDPELNLCFLRQQQNYANEKLKRQGYLFLNDVYHMLGFPKTQAGQTVGWLYDESNPNIDNYVDFGIYDLHNQAAHDFVNGRERSILLDFNVDGTILNNFTSLKI